MPVITPATSERNFTPNSTGLSAQNGSAGATAFGQILTAFAGGGGCETAAKDWIALATLSRPPVAVLPASAFTLSTPFKMADRTAAVLRDGQAASVKRTAPDTVERMLTPGAPSCTVDAP